MSLKQKLRAFFNLKEFQENKHDIDAPETTVLHGEIIRSKPFLKNIYYEWYRTFEKELSSLPKGKQLELGSGAGFIKEICPDVITSDVLDLPDIDMKIYGEDLPFEDKSLSAILMIDTLHHIPDPELFLHEADRCLVSGGKIIMNEPANSPWGRFIYQHFHHEPFNPAGDWFLPKVGPMSGANGALPHIIFIRDAELFKTKFPNLVIEDIRFHTPLRYLLSGGVSMRNLVPDWSFGFFTILDRIISAVTFGKVSMFQTIIIRKL